MGRYKDGKVHHDYAAVEVDAVELTGAGDTFAVSLFIARQKLQGDMQAATRVAARLAAHSVTRIGVDSAPTKDEIKEALRKLKGDE